VKKALIVLSLVICFPLNLLASEKEFEDPDQSDWTYPCYQDGKVKPFVLERLHRNKLMMFGTAGALFLTGAVGLFPPVALFGFGVGAYNIISKVGDPSEKIQYCQLQYAEKYLAWEDHWADIEAKRKWEVSHFPKTGIGEIVDDPVDDSSAQSSFEDQMVNFPYVDDHDYHH